MSAEKDGILDILEKSKGYTTALLTTFNFEIGFFEKAVLSRLLRNDIRKVSVFVDAKELTKSIESASPGSIGQRYVVNPVFMQSSFHPKVILLLGEKKARLIVSSANLTLSGYCINNEVFDCVDYNNEQPGFRNLFFDAIQFFERCNQYTPQLDSALLKSVRELAYNRKVPSTDSLRFLENTNKSILQQVKDIISEQIKEVLISVPYYDNALSALHSIHESFPDADIHLFLQHKKSTFPEDNRVEYISKVTVYDQVLAPAKENRHFYHGKVFLFKGVSTSYILYGSSNCTLSAFTKSRTEEGNVEANLFAKGTLDEFDSFFDQFPQAEGKKPDSQIMTFSSEEKKNYYFKYGLAEKKLVLHFGYHKKSNPKFIMNQKVLDWKQGDDEIIVEMDPINVDSIFDITIRYESSEEKIRCWYINRELLELNRISLSEENVLQDAADFGIGDKFLPDYEKLLKKMDSCKADYLNSKERLSVFLNTTGLQEENVEIEDDSDGQDDFVVTVDLSDADYAAYREYRLIERIRSRIITRYLNSSSLYFGSPSPSFATQSQIIEDGLELPTKHRRATTEEKRFERFVKRCVRGMLDKEFAEITDITHYFGLIAVVFDILNKYNQEEKIEGIFPDEYVISTRCDLLTLLLAKDIHEWEYKEKAVEKIVDIILNNHVIISNFDSIEKQGIYEQKNRKLLLLLDEQMTFRENFEQYIIRNRENALLVVDQNRLKAGISYMDNLFGYKTLDQIQALVKKNLGKNSGLALSRDCIYIMIYTDTPGRNLKPDTTILRELAKYSSRVRKIRLVIFDFKKQRPKRTDSVIQVTHVIQFERRRWSYTTISANGRKNQYPSTYISW